MVVDGVPVHCQCGNTMWIKRIGIGKRIRCPHCQTPNLVTEPEPQFPTIQQAPEFPTIQQVPEFPTIKQAESEFPAFQQAPQITAPKIGSSRSTPPRRNYVALTNIAGVFKSLAAVIFIAWFGATCLGLVALARMTAVGNATSNQGPDAIMFSVIIPWFVMTLASAFLSCLMWACAEIIQLCIDVQSNTYDAAYFR